METIRGKQTVLLDSQAFSLNLNKYQQTLIDLGTGDGRFVQHVARSSSKTFAIGVDACRENLRDVSRNAAPNSLYLIANAQALPLELYGKATRITINFPWGSLLEGLLSEDQGLLNGLAAIAQPHTLLEVRLNGGALSEARAQLEPGSAKIKQALSRAGFIMREPVLLGPTELRACHTTWANRLAFGRDPRAVYLRGQAR